MKILVGLVQHESNSFNPVSTTLADFNLTVGENILKKESIYQGSSLEGIINVFTKYGAEIIPTVYARPTFEGGLVEKAAYEEIKRNLIEQVKINNSNLDGVCLALHGSMTVEEIGDAEGDLLEAVRRIVGDDIPIVCALDMHAMVTKKMLANADALVSYRTAPHIDKVETGEKAAEILYDALTNNYQLFTAAVELPILISGEKSESAKFPMNELFDEIKITDQKEGVLAASYCLGFPWVDVEFNVGSVLVVTKNNSELARKEALRLYEKFINKLPDFNFTTETYSFEEAISIAEKEAKEPIFVIDSGDNPGAGGSQDISCTLEYLLASNASKVLYAVMADPAAYKVCAEAGLNKELSLNLGRRDKSIGSKSLELKGKVKKIAQYKDLEAAVLAVQGMDIIITTKKIVLTEPEFFESLELDFKNYKIVILKSGYLDPKLEPYTERVLMGLSPGYTNQVLEDLNYQRIKRPIYPFDDISGLKAKFLNED